MNPKPYSSNQSSAKMLDIIEFLAEHNNEPMRLKDIAEGLSKLVGEPVDKRKVVLDTDIKSFGTYEVELRVYPQVVAKLKVKVEE